MLSIVRWVISLLGGKRKLLLYGLGLAVLAAGAAGLYMKGRMDASQECETARLEGEIKTLELFGGIQNENAEIRAEHSGVDDTVKRLRDSTF
jgi:hypothetical protein